MALSDHILAFPFPKGSKMPVLEYYDGTSDPVQHLEGFNALMAYCGASNPIMCRAFPTTLCGAARTWFNRLPPKSIHVFRDLSTACATTFIGSRTHKRTSASLTSLAQRPNETLRDFFSRFNSMKLEIDDLDPAMAKVALIASIADVNLSFSLCKKEPEDLNELLARCKKFMNATEIMHARQETAHVRTNKKRLE
ncbi:uncharacterized protein LOC122659575 [Telopea speciosissima]|uniref:uncharacterized protein LOC122659575 n=1 Tax=Telopea speciosissima TaxID=54955 RepID=UPI001CC4A72F|nr:uncharacterized protein LOC122659575 [Telopea speciosissima]